MASPFAALHGSPPPSIVLSHEFLQKWSGGGEGETEGKDGFSSSRQMTLGQDRLSGKAESMATPSKRRVPTRAPFLHAPNPILSIAGPVARLAVSDLCSVCGFEYLCLLMLSLPGKISLTMKTNAPFKNRVKNHSIPWDFLRQFLDRCRGLEHRCVAFAVSMLRDSPACCFLLSALAPSACCPSVFALGFATPPRSGVS